MFLVFGPGYSIHFILKSFFFVSWSKFVDFFLGLEIQPSDTLYSALQGLASRHFPEHNKQNNEPVIHTSHNTTQHAGTAVIQIWNHVDHWQNSSNYSEKKLWKEIFIVIIIVKTSQFHFDPAFGGWVNDIKSFWGQALQGLRWMRTWLERLSGKFKINLCVRVKLEGLSAQRWAQFESIKFSLFIHLLHMDKTETLRN